MKNTIKSRKNFNFDDAAVIVLPALVVKYRKRLMKVGEYGIIASKRTFATAVRRNRARRLIREWMSHCDRPNRFDILFVARTKILETGLTAGVGQMAKALGKIKKEGKRPKKRNT